MSLAVMAPVSLKELRQKPLYKVSDAVMKSIVKKTLVKGTSEEGEKYFRRFIKPLFTLSYKHHYMPLGIVVRDLDTGDIITWIGG